MYSRLFEQEDIVDLPSLVTPEMEEYFIERTYKHIVTVQKNIKTICKYYPELKKELTIRGKNHDSDKFKKPWYYSYILRVWNKANPEYVRSTETLKLSSKAIFKHIKSNKHHIEYFRDVKQMSFVDLAEMIADNSAMSREFHTDLQDWFQKNVFSKKHFTQEQYNFLQDLINILS